MTDIERKLELTRFLREEDRANRMKIKSREEILYGTGKPSDGTDRLPLIYEGHLGDGSVEAAADNVRLFGFGVRLALACLLFGAVVYLDKNEISWNGEPAAAVISGQVESDFGIDTLLETYYDQEKK